MKKFTALICALLLFYGAKTQVIELMGEGIFGTDPVVLTFDDFQSIDSVVIEAYAVFRGISPGTVILSDNNENTGLLPTNFVLAEQDKSPSIPNGIIQHWGYYTATFQDVDANGILLDRNGQGENIKSIIAYIYRKGGNDEVYSTVQYDHAFVFENSSLDPLVYNFSIPAAPDVRDIVVKLPFSDMASGYTPRYAHVTIKAGTNSKKSEFSTNTDGEYLRIESITLEDIPGDITDVFVEIYSPVDTIDGKIGDSFLTGPALLTTTCERVLGCTYTQGYWKTHSEYGPASKPDATWLLIVNNGIGPDAEFYATEMNWLQVFNTSPGGNAYYILAHQYMAAVLNTLTGASVPSEVQDAISDAYAIFLANGPDRYKKVRGKTEASKEEIEELISLAETLTDYNEGTIGPGHCDDSRDDEMEQDVYEQVAAEVKTNNGKAKGKNKSGEIKNNDFGFNDLQVYPNPISNSGFVNYTPQFDGETRCEVYTLTGQKSRILFEQNTKKEIPLQFQIKASDFNEGTYMLVITNGMNRISEKIIVKH